MENLKHLRIFQNFTYREIKEIEKIALIKNFKKDEIIFNFREPREYFFIILKGQVVLYIYFNQNKEILNIETAGSFLSEESLLNPKSCHQTTALAQTDCQLLAISAKKFIKLRAKNNSLVNKIFNNIIQANTLDLYHARNRLNTVYRIGKIISEKYHQLPEMANGTIETLLSAIQAEKALFVFYLGESNQAQIIAARGFKNNKFLDLKIKLPVEPVIGEIFRTGKILNLSANEYLLSNQKVSYINNSVLGMPIIISKKVIASILLIDKKDEDQFNTNNILLLFIVAQLLHGALKEALDERNQKAEEELKRVYVEPI